MIESVPENSGQSTENSIRVFDKLWGYFKITNHSATSLFMLYRSEVMFLLLMLRTFG